MTAFPAINMRNRGGGSLIALALTATNKEISKRLAEYGIDATVDDDIIVMSHQLPHVHSGAFSRGVNALKNRAQVLENIRQTQLKEIQK